MKKLKNNLIEGLLIGIIVSCFGFVAYTIADISNPHPTPPSNSVTNAMLTATAVGDNVVDAANPITAAKIATSSNNFFVTAGAQTFAGVKTFSSAPLVPTSTPSGQQVPSAQYLINNFVQLSVATSVLQSQTTMTFKLISATTSWTAPVTGLYTFHVEGANGGGGGSPGKNGASTGTISINANTTYYIKVGGTTVDNTAGYNGGGAGVPASSFGGGGCTWISTQDTFTTSTVLIVGAGAGGNGSGNISGGDAGGATGSNGANGTGTGGTGGSTSTAGVAGGSAGQGGNAGSSAGGGGCGYFGGGAGQSGTAGGGGGSGFVSGSFTASSTGALSAAGTSTAVITYSTPIPGQGATVTFPTNLFPWTTSFLTSLSAFPPVCTATANTSSIAFITALSSSSITINVSTYVAGMNVNIECL